MLLLKAHSGARTAAIGDGGNDVAMIQAAHIGIGIVGKEGEDGLVLLLQARVGCDLQARVGCDLQARVGCDSRGRIAGIVGCRRQHNRISTHRSPSIAQSKHQTPNIFRAQPACSSGTVATPTAALHTSPTSCSTGA